MKEKYRTALSHGSWWLAFYIYEFGIYYVISGTISDISQNLVYYGINIALFYLHKGILDYTLGKDNKQYSKMILCVLAELIFAMIIKVTADYWFAGDGELLVMVKRMAAMDLYRTIFFIGLASLYWTALNIGAFRKRALEAEVNQLRSSIDNQDLRLRYEEARNSYLQQQINPHMLFNSLNFIHNTVYRYNLEAAESVRILADIMRYTYQEPGTDGKKSLDEELDQVANMIFINRVRYNYNLDIRYHIEGNTSERKIIPLVLMTLVENIFKHGDLQNHPVTILADIDHNGQLLFSTENHRLKKNSFQRIQSVGIANIEKRLAYSYGPNYTLTFVEKQDIFKSILKVLL